MKNKKTLFGFIAFAVIIFTLAGCGGSKPNGTYVDAEGDVSITFSGNKLTIDEYGEKIEGTYKAKDGKIHFTDGEYEESWEYSLEGNTLILDDTVFSKKTASKGNNTKGSLVGRWSLEEGSRRKNPEDMDLLKDGRGIVDGTGVTWKVENGRFYLMHPLAAFSSVYSISGSTLTLRKDDGEVLKYKKK